MTPEQKAKEIYDKFYGIPLYIKNVKQCCYIVADEMLEMDYPAPTLDELGKHCAYWEEVKLEISKL